MILSFQAWPAVIYDGPQSYSIFVKNSQKVFIFENFLRKVFPHAYCTSPNTTTTVLIRASLSPKVHFLKQIFGLNLNAVKPKTSYAYQTGALLFVPVRYSFDIQGII